MSNSLSSSDHSEAYIALGANLGEREQTLHEAIQMLHQQSAIDVLRCSGIYETAPVGYIDQPAFYNMVIAVRTTLQPEQLLDVMLDIENTLGRVRDIRWGPRTVDLDLLWMNGIAMDTERLQLPHPRMYERAFVLVPLKEIVQPQHTPQLAQDVTSALHQIQDQQQDIQYVHAYKPVL
ncbi:2-amino-4-hydroxy-6-hydroxymethyldihydropteridine diphosphokinase [Paenibacillus kandeliae]|uniref:2-amino-4-hydroxy-6- hydroxymethyldihydropteridine diphosphokinase n=1 Tax=Paenibacillus kandeliae TaxID=3231269 RepID=UPI003459A79F